MISLQSVCLLGGSGDPGELSHKESWSTPIIFKTSHLFDLFFLQ